MSIFLIVQTEPYACTFSFCLPVFLSLPISLQSNRSQQTTTSVQPIKNTFLILSCTSSPFALRKASIHWDMDSTCCRTHSFHRDAGPCSLQCFPKLIPDLRIRPRCRQFEETNVDYKNRGQAEVSNPEQSPKGTERQAGSGSGQAEWSKLEKLEDRD